MKVKIEFEVNADFNKVMKCIYDRVDCLYYELLDIDSNFKDIDIEIRTHDNKIVDGTPHINFHKPLPNDVVLDMLVSTMTDDTKKALRKILLNSLYGSTVSTSYGYLKCPMYHNGTCWGTRDKEKCTCGGFKSYCTHYPKGE